MAKNETINDRISYIIENQCKGNQKKFAETIGFAPQVVYNIVSGRKSKPSFDVLEAILSSFVDISSDWLLTGKGEMLKSDNIKAISAGPKEGIPLLPYDAFAGIGDSTVNGVAFDTIEERYVIPLFDGLKVDFMLPVRGSSMYPKYSSGDVVACRLVNELLFVQWNKVYVIDSISQGILMKRLIKSEDPKKVICRSDNKDYGDFEVPLEDIRNIALVVGVIRLE